MCVGWDLCFPCVVNKNEVCMISCENLENLSVASEPGLQMIFAFNILKPVGGLDGDFDNCTICFISITKKIKYNRNISGKYDD